LIPEKTPKGPQQVLEVRSVDTHVGKIMRISIFTLQYLSREREIDDKLERGRVPS
jgi:hypothetical protein